MIRFIDFSDIADNSSIKMYFSHLINHRDDGVYEPKSITLTLRVSLVIGFNGEIPSAQGDSAWKKKECEGSDQDLKMQKSENLTR